METQKPENAFNLQEQSIVSERSEINDHSVQQAREGKQTFEKRPAVTVSGKEGNKS